MHHASVPAREWMREASTSRLHPLVRRLLVLALVACAYTLGGELGLAHASIGRQVTLVWPPTGIALAALVLGGAHLWPAIAFGAAVTNLAQGAPLFFTVPVTAGNTLAMVTGAWLLQRRGFAPSLERTRDVFDLLFRGAMIPTIVSATIGTLAVCATHVAPWSTFFRVWSIWWVGDALGIVILAPLLLTLGTSAARRRLRASHVLSAGAAGAFAWVLCAIAYPLPWLVFPLAILVAMRLGTRAAAMVVAAVCLASVAQTTAGRGIFGALPPPLDLALLDLFLYVVAMTTLLAAAMVTEIQTAERARAQLAAQVAQARERAEVRELVLGAITHDLQNPLATISLSIGAILKRETGGEQRRLLDIAAAAASA
jgi:integral membrane sensor domain MASE1